MCERTGAAIVPDHRRVRPQFGPQWHPPVRRPPATRGHRLERERAGRCSTTNLPRLRRAARSSRSSRAAGYSPPARANAGPAFAALPCARRGVDAPDSRRNLGGCFRRALFHALALPDHETEGRAKLARFEKRVARFLRPRRKVSKRAGVGRKDLDKVAAPHLVKRTPGRGQDGRAWQPAHIQGSRDGDRVWHMHEAELALSIRPGARVVPPLRGGLSAPSAARI